MAEWYLVVDGKSVGPMTREALLQRLATAGGPDALVFGPGVSAWTPAKHVPGLGLSPHSAASAAPPSVAAASRRAHEIDYEINGSEMQFVEIELDPGETVVAEAGAMMYMTSGIEMQTRFGDPSQEKGLLGKVWDAGKRMLTGESLFMTTFTGQGPGRQSVAFAAPYPGKILAMDLAQLGGELLCQKESFLCAAKGVSVGIAFTRRIGTGLFGGEGFILQKLTGDGMAFVHAGGTLSCRTLGAGERLRVDTGCLVAFQPSVDYDIKFVGGIRNTLFGGEGLFFVQLTGPGQVWLQSLPFSRLVDRIRAVGQFGARGKEEGSILGGLLGGDRR